MNSKKKGSRGERELAETLRGYGLDSHRNDQRYVSGLENPDVSLPGVHIEVKRTEALRLYDSMNQAVRDANGKAVPVVMHRRNRSPWLVVMRLEDWAAWYRGDDLYGEA